MWIVYSRVSNYHKQDTFFKMSTSVRYKEKRSIFSTIISKFRAFRIIGSPKLTDHKTLEIIAL